MLTARVHEEALWHGREARIFLGRMHRNALEALEKGLEERLPLMALTGPSGLGKTVVLNLALESVPGSVRTVRIDNPRLGPLLFCQKLGALAGLAESDAETRPHGGRTQRALIVIDDAHLMQPETLHYIALLVLDQPERDANLQVLFVGLPAFWDLLADPDLAGLRDRIAQRARITPLPETEARNYVVRLLGLAGPVARRSMTDEAIHAIARLSEGKPTKMNRLVAQTLAAGARRRVRVTRAMVARAAADKPVASLGLRLRGHLFPIFTTVVMVAGAALSCSSTPPRPTERARRIVQEPVLTKPPVVPLAPAALEPADDMIVAAAAPAPFAPERILPPHHHRRTGHAVRPPQAQFASAYYLMSRLRLPDVFRNIAQALRAHALPPAERRAYHERRTPPW